MAWRVREEQVRALIDDDTTIRMAPFIDTANALTDFVANQDSASLLTSALKTQIELYLAAHFYEHRDPQPIQESTMKASATYQGKLGEGLKSSKWGQTAVALDVTGTLASLSAGRKTASVMWLGLPPSSQTDYELRD